MKMTASPILACILFLLLLIEAGCGTVESMYSSVGKSVTDVVKVVRPDPEGLRKKVLVLPFFDHGGMGEAKVAQLTSQFRTLLGKDAQLLLIQPSDPLPSTTKIRSPRFGVVTDADIAKRAEEMGMNVLLTVILNPMEVQTIKTGIWPFRKFKHEVEMSMAVNALDISNGTLVLSHLESEKVTLAADWIEADEEEEKPKPPEIDEKTYTKMWSRILERQVSFVTRSLRGQPWSGRVLSADGRSIIINGGNDVGLTSGRVLEVYKRGDPIRSADGRSFFFLGPKVGEIRTTEVMDSYSSAVPLTEAQFKAGQVIRVKN